MKIKVLNKKIKTYYKVINSSLLIWMLLLLGFVIFLSFENKLLNKVAVYALILSCLPLLLALFSAVLSFIEKKFVEIDESVKTYLVLNITEEDYKQGKTDKMGYCGNFLIEPVSGSEFELTSTEVKKLIKRLANDDLLSISYQTQKTSLLEVSPRAIVNNVMWTLWGASS